MYEEQVYSVLAFWDLKPETLLKKKYGKNKEIRAKKLIVSVLNASNLTESAKEFNCSASTLEKVLKTLDRGNKTQGVSWNFYLETLSGILTCTVCNTIKHSEEFVTSGGTKRRMCKDCDSKRRKERYEKNPELSKTYSANYRARKVKATPIWSDSELIRLIYSECPKGYEVDHIYPLNGDLVSGLHVHENLQYLTVRQNRSKGNKSPN